MAKATKKQKQPQGIEVLNREYDPACPIDSLQPHPDNPREADCGAIHESIKHNGFYGAIVAQKATGYILAGNHRYKTLIAQGATTIPTIWIDCDAAAAKRILIADNRLADIASYNEPALAELLEQIKIDETNLGWQGTGWDDESFQNLLGDLSGPMFAEEQKPAESIGNGEIAPDAEAKSLADRFVIPPFSVLDARQGYWQERKRAWLALGIQSELGRGAEPGGSARPACDYSSKQRGDGSGRPISV